MGCSSCGGSSRVASPTLLASATPAGHSSGGSWKLTFPSGRSRTFDTEWQAVASQAVGGGEIEYLPPTTEEPVAAATTTAAVVEDEAKPAAAPPAPATSSTTKTAARKTATRPAPRKTATRKTAAKKPAAKTTDTVDDAADQGNDD